jgi:hypothetical protein
MSLEDSHVTVTSMPRKMVAGVGSAPTSADFQPAAHLSEPSSVWKVVPRRGDAPRSPAYRAGALLLSYGGMGSVVQPSRLWLQTQSRELHHTNETGSSGWVRTNAAALTERHPTVRSPRILKWWTRTVTLRRLLCAKQPCWLLSLRAL